MNLWINQWNEIRSLIPCGESVPSWEINFSPRFFRLSVFSWCIDSPQIVMLWWEWLGRSKWRATGLDDSWVFLKAVRHKAVRHEAVRSWSVSPTARPTRVTFNYSRACNQTLRANAPIERKVVLSFSLSFPPQAVSKLWKVTEHFATLTWCRQHGVMWSRVFVEKSHSISFSFPRFTPVSYTHLTLPTKLEV